ncbi:MAG: gamma-glutamyltransferase 1 [Chthoniobacteraceae bacterium]|nr:gamma-glutamyltransferase 1 [Chthoniobacteraceae bacterium]
MVPLLRISVRAVLTLLICSYPAAADPARGTRGIVATGHALATEAGVNAMKDGGNAVDAAVAAALTLGVVDGSNSGIGGGCFFLIHTAKGEVIAIDGRETAPLTASRDMFVRNGKPDTRLSQVGALASGTPSALAAYHLAVERFGKLTLKSHLLAAAEVAERGFQIDRRYAGKLKSTADDLAQFESSKAVYFKSDGRLLAEGDLLKQTDLAGTYRNIAEHGIGWFYGGPFAEITERWMKQNAGLLTVEDFKRYQPKLREPVRSTYRGYEIFSFPPPSSGGVHVVEILNILENFPLRSFGHNSADAIHLIAEAMKLAFADRAHWLGDPDFTPVPRGLVSREYAKELAGRIQIDRVTPVPTFGTPAGSDKDLFEKHTTHLSTADSDGNWVACTATINTTFGSKVVVPGTGVLLNNQMDDFSIQPGVPNAFGLVGGDANAVAPGKRPLSSMSPTILLKDHQPLLAVGAAGGPTIISQTLLAILGIVDFDLDPEKALASPRFHHQWKPDELKIETSLDPATRAALRLRGHSLSEVDSFGVSQAVGRDSKSFVGVSDPRSNGTAAGW